VKRLLIAAALVLATSAEARDPAQVRAFRKANPCPATGSTTGACPGWVVDHMVPLCAGGPDDPANMAWQERSQSLVKDAHERRLCARIRASMCSKGTP
jgi:hypothetical protein